MTLTDLTVSRTIHATPGDVFDVRLDPKSPGGPWFGAERVILNAAVDGEKRGGVTPMHASGVGA